VNGRGQQAHLAGDGRLQPCAAKTAEAIMQASGERTVGASARDSVSGGECSGRICWTALRWSWEASPSLRKLYPPAENPARGGAHWPVLRIVVLHDLETGLAEEPHWGPMYGNEAVGEQQLAREGDPGAVSRIDCYRRSQLRSIHDCVAGLAAWSSCGDSV